MDEADGTYAADDECFDNHDYDDTDDDNDHKNDSYTADGAAPGAGAAPGSWFLVLGSWFSSLLFVFIFRYLFFVVW